MKDEKKSFSAVKVHSKLTMVSGRPTEPSGKIHKFTALDRAMGPYTLHLILYYSANPFKDGPAEFDLNNLRVAVAELLCLYPIMTGRLIRGEEDGDLFVKCNDAGVRVLRASVGTTLQEWMRSAADERQLTVWEDMPLDPALWSPFQIQMNDFECGGLAIGLSFPHMYADPTSAMLFLKALSEVYRGQPITHPPIFDLPPLFRRKSPTTKNYQTNSRTETDGVDVLKTCTATFRFSDSVIKHCLSQLHRECPETTTPFDFLAALFWSRIAAVAANEHDVDYHSLSLCVDLRNHLHQEIPYGYFGNALHFSLLSVNPEEFYSGEVGHLAGLVHSHLAGVKLEDEFSSNMADNERHAPPLRMYGPELTCINMEHMEKESGSLAYAATFKKNEKPIHTSFHVGKLEGERLIRVMPSPEEGLGRTVMVTLPEEQIARLLEDQAILDLKPVMLFSGKR